jgi:signal transduction histidine kinase
MTLQPVPPGVGAVPDHGPPTGPQPTECTGVPAFGDDEARLRRTAHSQWMRRRDLERQLHDGAALRISALALRLGLLRHRRPDDERELQEAIDDLQGELHEVLQELREVAGNLYPPLLDEVGLGPALREVADRSAVPVRIDAPDERFGAAAEGAAYFTLLGCLTAAPHRGSTERSNSSTPVRAIEVVIRREGDALVVVVDGVDACHAAAVHDGVRLLGGTVEVGVGALITVRIPCA